MKDYQVLTFRLQPLEPFREVLLAWLDQMGYEGFEETPEGLKAYVATEAFSEEELQSLPLFSAPGLSIEYEREDLERINWNEAWERAYAPVRIDDKLLIRAPFHPEEEGFAHRLVIEPKMSFGTGHHPTTRLMVRAMWPLPWQGRSVLDMGSGTGVLAILAALLGAAEVTAIDNFDWAVENTRENAERNGFPQMEVRRGEVDLLAGRKWEIILANINRNVLAADLPHYVEALEPEGYLLLSGFMQADAEGLISQAEALGLRLHDQAAAGDWLCLTYQK